jgi:hypothetical protein
MPRPVHAGRRLYTARFDAANLRMANKVLVILGMHRSGTSVVTRWLHECGLNVGETLLGAGVGNVEGHFEDMALYRFHRTWLERHRLPHTGFVHAPVPPLTADGKAELRRLIAERNARFEAWGWKEPRTCLFLDDYRELLPDARYLVIFRDFRETVSSMISRIQRQKDHKYASKRGLRGWWWFRVRKKRLWRKLLTRETTRFLKVWIFYNRQILACLRNLEKEQYTVVCCASLLRDDGDVFSTLAEGWGFPLRHVPFQEIYKPDLTHAPLDIDAWIDAGLLREAERVQQELAALAAPTA